MIKVYLGLALVLALLGALLWALHEHDDGIRAEGAATQTARDLATSEANRTEEQRRVTAQHENDNEAQRMASRARADAAGAGDSRARLLQRAAQAAAGACNPGPASVSPPAQSAAGVLADVLRRADERAGLLADYADQARVAGEACERAYDSLTSSRPP